MWRRYPATSSTAAFTLLACGVALFAADRPARVITPEGSPIWLDPQRTLVFDAPSLTVMLRNEHSQPVNYALRLWVFDESTTLKGTQDFCTYDALGSHSRVLVVIPIAIAGVTLRDRTVVSVTAAVSGQANWSLREDARAQLEAALAAARGSAARLTFQREAARPGGWSCPCDCAALETACEQRCADAGRVFSSCNRTLDGGCSAACTCTYAQSVRGERISTETTQRGQYRMSTANSRPWAARCPYSSRG